MTESDKENSTVQLALSDIDCIICGLSYDDKISIISALTLEVEKGYNAKNEPNKKAAMPQQDIDVTTQDIK